MNLQTGWLNINKHSNNNKCCRAEKARGSREKKIREQRLNYRDVEEKKEFLPNIQTVSNKIQAAPVKMAMIGVWEKAEDFSNIVEQYM